MAIDPKLVKWDSEPATSPKIDPRMVKWEEVKEPSMLDQVKQGIGNVIAGGVRGAGSLGATTLTPIDALARLAGVENAFIGRKDRRQAMRG